MSANNIKVIRIDTKNKPTVLNEKSTVTEIEVQPLLINLSPAIEVEPDFVNVLDVRNYFNNVISLLEGIDEYETFVSKIKEILILFDTDPKLYEKQNYIKLISLITLCFKGLYNKDITSWIIHDLNNATNSNIPSALLVKLLIESINNKLLWIVINDGDE